MVQLVLVSGAMPASAGQLASGRPGRSASILEPLQPGPPTGLTATTVSSSEVDLSWTAPAPCSSCTPTVGYEVFVGTSQDGESNTAVNSALITGTTYPVTGLSAGTTYWFVVMAVDAKALGTYAYPDVPAATVPGPPTGLTATTVSSSEVDLSWTAPSGDSPPAGYNVYVATSPGGESDTTAVNSAPITGTTYPVTGLSAGTTYYFEVTAVDAASKESGFSNEVQAPTPVPASATATPTTATSPASASPSSIRATNVAAGSGSGTPLLLLGVAAGLVVVLLSGWLLRHRPAPVIAQSVRAVPHAGPPEQLSVQKTGTDATHTVRIEPHQGAASTTTEEREP
jgi:hypothetical protein